MSSSSIPNASSPLHPAYPLGEIGKESETTQNVIQTLKLLEHPEGGYFSEIDRDPLIIPNPFLHSQKYDGPATAEKPMSGDNSVRNASTSIYYLLTRVRGQGHFHRNKGRTVHTVIEGRGRYVLIHADESDSEGKKRVESFVVGKDVIKGEKAVWIVEGGKYKASYLLPMDEGRGNKENDRLLISETVVPGFEYSDHDFLGEEKFNTLVTEQQARELEWLVRNE